MTTQEFMVQLNAGRKDFDKLPDDLIVFYGTLDLRNSQIQSLGNLEKVLWGSLYLRNTPITSLGNLEKVGRNLYLQDTQIQSLDNLEKVGWNLYLSNTPLAEKYSIKQLEEMYPHFKGKFLI